MPFIQTNPHDDGEGHLACDWNGCRATSPTYKRGAGIPCPAGWDMVGRKTHRRKPRLTEYFCAEHVEAARARAVQPYPG